MSPVKLLLVLTLKLTRSRFDVMMKPLSKKLLFLRHQLKALTRARLLQAGVAAQVLWATRMTICLKMKAGAKVEIAIASRLLEMSSRQRQRQLLLLRAHSESLQFVLQKNQMRTRWAQKLKRHLLPWLVTMIMNLKCLEPAKLTKLVLSHHQPQSSLLDQVP
jgi:hypothetical protein